jgi:hypothetical protein
MCSAESGAAFANAATALNEVTRLTAATVRQIGDTLTEISDELDAAKDQVALLHVITRRRGGGSDPAADAGRA